MLPRSGPVFAFSHLNEAVRTYFKAIADEPLPERWADLILHLDEKERIASEAEAAEQVSAKGSRRIEERGKDGPRSR